MTISYEATLMYSLEEPEFLEIYYGRGASTLFFTPAILGETRTLFAFGRIVVTYNTPTGKRQVEYQINGNDVTIAGKKCVDTPIYIREPDYLYMVKSYRSFEAFKEQFDKGKFYRRWKMPVPDEPTKVVRHFEIYFGKSVTDFYVPFNGEVYSSSKKDSESVIDAIDIGWAVQSRVSDRNLDMVSLLVDHCKEPILLTDVKEPKYEVVCKINSDSEVRDEPQPEREPVKVHTAADIHDGIDNWTPSWKPTRPPFGSSMDHMLDAM